MKTASAALYAFAAISGSAIAQENIVGQWTGSFAVNTGRKDESIFIELTVKNVDGGNVLGAWRLASGNCMGDYPFTGTFKNQRLRIKTEAGAKAGCGPYGPLFELRDGMLVGQFAKQEVTLKK